ncbi:MAG: hypothetical protein Q8P67_07595, partial [archaeon]|nr:hypothetical protein [archaeon]
VNRELAEEAVAASLTAKTEKEEATQKKLKEKRQTRDISPVAPPLSKTAFVDLMMKGILLAREDSVRALFRKYFQQQPSATAAGGAEPEHFELTLRNQVREAMESIRRTSQETTEMYAKLRDFSHEEITNHCPGFADLPDTDPDQLALESVLSTLHLLSGAATSENAAAAAALVEQAPPPPPSAPPALLSIREQLAALDTEEAQDSLIDGLVGSDDDEQLQDAAGQIVDGGYSDGELSGDDAPVLGDDLSDLDLSDSDDLSSLLAIPEDSRKSVAVSDTSKGTEGFKKGHDDDEFAPFAEDNELAGFDEAGEVNGEGSELEDEGAEEDVDEEEAQEEALSDIDCEDDETDIDELSQGPEHEYELSSETNADDQSDDDDEETDEEGVKSFESIISQQHLPTLGNARDLIVNLASKQNLTLSNAMIEELASSAHQQLLQLRAEKPGDQVEGHSDGSSDEKAQEAGSASGLDDHEPDDLDDDDNEATDKPYLGVRLASRSDKGGHLFSLQTLAEAEFRTNMRLVQFPDFATAVHSRILKPTGAPPAWAIKDIADVPSRLVEDILAPFSDPQEELGEINQFSHLGHNLRSSMFARYRARLLAKPSEKKMMQFAERELFGGSHHC